MKEYLVDDPKIHEQHPHTSYDLVANISHEGEPGADKGNFRVHVYHKVIKSQSFLLLDI